MASYFIKLKTSVQNFSSKLKTFSLNFEEISEERSVAEISRESLGETLGCLVRITLLRLEKLDLFKK